MKVRKTLPFWDKTSSPLARAAGLSRAEVALLRLYTGPWHAALQFYLRARGADGGARDTRE